LLGGAVQVESSSPSLSLKAHGFNPCAYEVLKNWFPKFAL
jgi:hypothetical protein